MGITIIVSLLTALCGGLVGTYCGARFLNARDDSKMKRVRTVASNAIKVLKKYSKQSYRKAENEFNTSFSLTEKRIIIVALHKLGVPVDVPTNEVFNLRSICFVDRIVDKDELDNIEYQIKKGYCDNLFYMDPDSYFASNYVILAVRNAGKKYVNEVLLKSEVDPATKTVSVPIKDLSQVFTLGEFKAIQVFREQVNDQMYFDDKGKPIKEKIDTLIRDIDLGLWDSYLMWNYEVYQSVKAQIQMSQVLSIASQSHPAVY